MSSPDKSSSKKSTGSRFDLCLTPPYSPVVQPRRTDSTSKVRTSLFLPSSEKEVKAEEKELAVGNDEECILNLNGLTQGIQNMLVCATYKSNDISLTARNLGTSSVLTIHCQKCDRERIVS